ncbi:MULTISPECIES: hypothetical protein [Rosenbergiella]|uniref:hypothetical protein n=1 Tax=Rosenbergiella TaxID=1356488 RepID=UPI001F4EFF23
MMIAASYTLHLHCDCDECTAKKWGSPDFGEYVGETWSECSRAAKKDGWFISKDRTACLSPSHKGKD